MKTSLFRSRRAALVLFGVIAVGAAGLALAHSGARGKGFGAIDADGDKAVTQAEIEAAASARFVAIDVNRDGQITIEEIRSYRERQRTERQAARLARLDSNSDGRISQDEFVAARAERLMKFDRNGDGVLDANDRRHRRDRG
jgi:hypothetical protein